MAVAFRSATDSGPTALVTSRSAAVPPGLQDGDIVVAFLECWTGAVVSLVKPSGFIQRDPFSTDGATFTSADGQARNYVFAKRVTSASTDLAGVTYDFSWSGSKYATLQVMAFYGGKSTGEFWDTTAPGVVGTFGSVTDVDMVTSDPDGALVWSIYSDSSGTHTPPTGFTTTSDVDCASQAYRLAGGTNGAITVSGASVSSSSSCGVWVGALLSDSTTANKQVWYKADAITGQTDGAEIGEDEWPDSTGNGYDVEQYFGGLFPTYQTGEINGLPVVRFDDDALRSTAPHPTTDLTVFVVFRPDDDGAVTNGRRLWSGDGGTLNFRYYNGVIEVVRIGGGLVLSGVTAFTVDEPHIAVMSFESGTAASLYLDGALDATTTHSATLSASTYTYLGASGLFGGEGMIGDLAEVIVYDELLSGTDRDTITDYLSDKWDVPLGGPTGTTATPAAATGTGAAFNPTALVRAFPPAATGTGAAFNPTGSTATSTTVTPPAATGTGQALSPTVRITALPPTATGTGQAFSPTANVRAFPAAATGTGAANNPTASTASSTTATPAAATGTGAALSPTVRITAPLALATGTGQAFNPTASVPGSTTATPPTATGTGQANNVTARVVAPVALATGTGAALSPAVRVAALPPTATGTGAAFSPAVRVTAPLAPATGTGTAFNPTALTVPITTATPATATGTGQAFNPIVRLVVIPATATGTGTAFDPSGTGRSPALPLRPGVILDEIPRLLGGGVVDEVSRLRAGVIT